ncbi:uncharacterized protein LOC132196588 [Neocloeon triangulifer]|uniref:uncharacterized protein LOC132196588 n=1 Tax=Neocloeon triangulifer TaxID=2078957 RepID=UPI00286F5613|nr:uncharacterized protein LOC132196588 [Neocloeon triangulifer]
MDSLNFIHKGTAKPKRNFLNENKRLVKNLEKQFREAHISEQRTPLSNQKYSNVQPKVQTRNHNAFPTRPASSYATSSRATCSQQRPMSAVTTCDEGVQCETKVLHSQGTQTAVESMLSGRELRPSAASWEERSQLQLRLNIEEEEESVDHAHQATQGTTSTGDKLVRWDLQSDAGDKEASVRSKASLPSVKSIDDNSKPFNEEERLQYLSQLKATQDKLIADLNRLPVRSNTLRVQTRRREIDVQLDKVEALITAFSRPGRSLSRNK